MAHTESFGNYIRRIRIEKGMNQTQLAALIGLDSGGLSKIETGKKELKEDKLILLADVFKIGLNEIKEQYFSEKFATACYKNNCPESVFYLAEEKARYYKEVNVKQGNLNL